MDTSEINWIDTSFFLWSENIYTNGKKMLIDLNLICEYFSSVM